ncbi:putative DNA primase/helicase [Devosia crocina]|uniref:Putative DNA primase/helicase n=1 Tax=Devosia crocina TaxID=429728 RepID=A0A1I7NF98_9HYPH|nr:DNA primase family protein [Devosia crocina]SFV33216.1 putative DNA primase/helicase [Devosia crocina]
MTDTPDDDNPVKKAAQKRTKVTLTVVDGGKGATDKPKRGGRKTKAEAEPLAADPNDPGHDGEDLPDLDADFGNNDNASENERIIIRFCKGLDQNDRDNGRRLVAWFGDSLLYVTGLGWLVWRGSHWLRDEADLEVRLLAQFIVDKIKLEAIELEATDAEKKWIERADAAMRKKGTLTSADENAIKRGVEIRTALSKRRSSRRAFAISSGNASKTKAMIEQAQSLKAMPIERLDADDMLFNIANGTLRFWRELDPDQPEGGARKIGRFEFRPHDRDDLITKMADVEYHAEAECEFFRDGFLGKVQPEARWRTFIQVSTAVALLFGGNDEQKLFYHYGTGANGKSAFFELIGRLAGSYRQIASPETITGDGQRAGQQANPDIARLHNARLVTIEELPKNTPLKEELIKALTGGTKILARFLNKDFFEFMPKFTPMLSGNNKPAISGTDEGIWRRFLFVIWGVKIPEGERMAPTLLAAKLDAERSGVLNWLIEGALLYLTHGLDHFTPPEAKAFAQDYREERDNVGVFAEACIERVEGKKVRAGALFEAYEAWCKANGLRAASQRSFGDRLNDLGYKKERGAYYVYLDVQLKAEPPQTSDAGGPPPRDPDDPGF